MAARYDRIGTGYARTRRPDPRLERALWDALGPGTVVNAGAGSGNYEPASTVVAVEPSLEMIRQRRPGAAPVVRGVAEALPLADGSVDAALAVLTIHHWADWRRGIAELRRVARRVVVFTWDHEVAQRSWLMESFPSIRTLDDPRAVPIDGLVEALGGDAEVHPWPIPADCEDGFLSAWWARPEAYLDPEVRNGMSVFRQQPTSAYRHELDQLRADLEDGTWHDRYGHLLEHDTLDAGYRVVVA